MTKDDFFEGETKKGGSAPKKKDKKSSKDKKGGAAFAYAINLYLAIALIVTAFAVGFVVRPFVLPSDETSTTTEEGTTMEAPPLSEEQMQGGQMPEGHPQVGTEATSTPSETTTPSGNQ